MKNVENVNIEFITVVFDGALIVLSLTMIVLMFIYLAKEVISIISELKKPNKLDCSKGLKHSCYQKGYEDGMKEGLSQAHKMVEQLLKEKQIKIDSTFDNEGDE